MKKVLALTVLLSLAACAPEEGDRGRSGSQGQQGIQGEQGEMGPRGATGADGQPAQVVPLCPGISNYGAFVEVALCINNNLYAVYSANGGFLTYLAPGNYSSNGIGSACNLTVHNNCVVTNP